MSYEEVKIFKGLKNVYVAESRICLIDHEKGKIYYYGYDLDELAVKSSFEEVLYLLLYGKLPNRNEYREFIDSIKGSMDLPLKLRSFISELPRDIEVMEAIRTVVSYLGNLRGDGLDLSRESIIDYAVDLIAKMPAIISYIYRARYGYSLLKPRDDLSLAGNLLYLITGNEYSDVDINGLDMSLILYAEHGMNASTFASIVIALTGSDYYSSIVGGIAALRGPLHGYA
ncbi:TPA: citrate/2-methylcitrate synthase, partial [Candidatus Geothermarchaeota archaeon]|nr:citrate/2-methylcitrate synthase [Candidatus Geothermarchaeota archaeon]